MHIFLYYIFAYVLAGIVMSRLQKNIFINSKIFFFVTISADHKYVEKLYSDLLLTYNADLRPTEVKELKIRLLFCEFDAFWV